MTTTNDDYMLTARATKANANLHKAKAEKDDEFYTKLSDIEREINHYKDQFKGKSVLCNCDDPDWSNFWLFFTANFKRFGLKKLVSTHYALSGTSYKLVMTEKGESKKIPLGSDGDFRSPECIQLLREADIVVTNPPFSLFREYIAQLIQYDKQFIVVGNFNAVATDSVFPLIRDNRLWLGVSPRSMQFIKPDGGTSTVNATWFTNMFHEKRDEKVFLYKKYVGNEQAYPKFDNCDAIEVSKVVDIPMDYAGVMGVPITFLDKYNPNQFDLIGNEKEVGIRVGRALINKVSKYARVFIRNKHPKI